MQSALKRRGGANRRAGGAQIVALPPLAALLALGLLLGACVNRPAGPDAAARCEILPVAGTPALREVCGAGDSYRIRTWYPVAFEPPPIYGLPGGDSDRRQPRVIVITK